MKEQKIILLVSWNMRDDEEFPLLIEFSKDFDARVLGLNRKYAINNSGSKTKIILYFKYLYLAIKSLLATKKNDLIVTWSFNIGFFVGLFNRLFLLKRNVFALNMIAHKKDNLLGTLKDITLKFCINTPNFFATVNSADIIKEYKERFNYQNGKIFVVNDPYSKKLEVQQFCSGKGYVFAGGEAERDWDIIFKAANSLPEIKFICVARKKGFKKMSTVPVNVELLFDIDLTDFESYLKDASIVLITVRSTSTAGLIVLIRAALLSKPIIATRTSSIQNYIENNKDGVLIPFSNDNYLAVEIESLLYNKELQKKYGNAIRIKTIENMSQENHALKVKHLIEEHIIKSYV